MRIFITVLLWLAEMHRTATALTLRGEFPRSPRINLLELESTRWEATADTVSAKTAPSSNAKLELSDLKDNVDFHMNHLSEALKEKLSNAIEVVDPVEMERLKDACDKVENRIRDLQATIKSKCDEEEEIVNQQSGDHESAELHGAVESAKKRLKSFVDDGIKEIGEKLNNLFAEFTVSETEDANKTRDGDVNENAKGAGAATGDKSVKEMPDAEKPLSKSMIQVSGDSAYEESGSIIPKNQISDNTVKEGKVASKQNVNPGGGQMGVPKSNASKDVKHAEVAGNASDALKGQSNLVNSKNQSSNIIRGEVNGNHDDKRAHTTSEAGAATNVTGNTAMTNGVTQHQGSPDKPNNIEAVQSKEAGENDDRRKAGASDNAKSAPAPKSEAEQASKLAKVPPAAITRTVNQYLQTLNSEADKLVTDIQLKLHRTKTY
ncbi:hypothetical protein, conserved [Babesia bigemina]|uniref:Uncharacterized protein n=1 Tax=Babesia bigemina TaxID=5866 RepID=A0A061D2P0_BABBI|nr:hypothetical protein, conserved [Babesia bigemina]CDR94332.1 hypothetical protein, conserved [Babesia bigemina]|eukprot:XP_012766518.1 hypothetical protein, conserved [Babesia bigemina]